MKSADDMATDVLARWLQTSNLENSMELLAEAFRAYGEQVKEMCAASIETHTTSLAVKIRNLKLP